jgi:lipopolysaccharide export LptBFGC system permease protein LptF
VEAAAGEEPGPSARWFRIGSDIVRAAPGKTEGTVLISPLVYRRDQTGDIQSITRSGTARWTGQGWRLAAAQRWTPQQAEWETLTGTEARWSTSLDPSKVRRFFAAPVPVSSRDAALAIQGKVPADRARALYQTRRWLGAGLLAAPLVMLLLAVALIVGPRQEMPLSRGLALAGLAGLTYLVLDGWLQILGQTGAIATAIAISGAPGLFTLLGIHLLLRSERVT